jgi:hypothetical protein
MKHILFLLFVGIYVNVIQQNNKYIYNNIFSE